MTVSLPIQDKVSRISFQLALVFWLAQIFALVSSWRHLPPQLPLFYSRPWGEEQLASPLGLLLLPGLSIGVMLINLAVNLVFSKQTVLIRRIMAATAAVFSFLCLITLTQIIRLVI